MARSGRPSDSRAPADGGAFAPLRHRVFAVLWTATLVGNVGLWMRDTTSAWLMTSLSASPTQVAFIQAASTLPIFLFSLPAGALADIVDRKRLLILVQFGLGLLSVALAIGSALSLLTPVSLLLFTAAAGVGSAFANPVWQAIVPELVPRSELRPAVALNGVAVNVSRAIGPALGGLIVALSSPAIAYAVDVATYAIVIAALVWWPRTTTSKRQPEAFTGALRAGWRYALRSPPLQRTVVRAICFFLFASAYWALLPLVAKNELNGGPSTYGLLLGALGSGAVTGALLLQPVRKRLNNDSLVLVGTLVTAATTAALGLVSSLTEALPVLLVAGFAWICVLSSINTTTQAVLPDWVRARGLAVYLMAFFGSLSLGSVVWGRIAEASSVDQALIIAGSAGALVGVYAARWKLPSTEVDLTPSGHWPQPIVTSPDDGRDGPALITVDYRIDIRDREPFLEAIEALGDIRRRDGAIQWAVMFDSANPNRALEWFVTPSWAEHVRQHDRVSVADAAVQERVKAFHRGADPPRVAHFLTASRTKQPSLTTEAE
ncbi:MFS transporter [Bosea eneae]|uniref:MFS transporter n=1 Tax=Bosea eneae TaxID=151454 RepID=A0ABW0IZ28_9HYPH